MPSSTRPLAVVTGASSGIGLELAKRCAEEGFDLLIAADEAIDEASRTLREAGAEVQAVEADLATREGVARLHAATNGRPIDALLANAGHGLGGAFLDQEFDDVRHVIDTNVTGTLDLIQRVGRDMRQRGQGRILITGSIAGAIPGTYNAVYNGTKALIDSFAFALRAEVKDTGVTITCLMPGATETEFFERAGMTDTRVGQGKKDDPAMVARAGFDAMMKGEADVVTGWKNKLQTTLANVTPNTVLAERHRRSAEPGGAQPGTNMSMNAIQFLEREHEKAKAEFEKVLEASPVQRGALWTALAPQLKQHEELEDACLYKPLSRDAAATDPTLAQWRERHHGEVSRVEGLMRDVEALDVKSPAWLAKVMEIHASLETHIQEEEDAMFPRIPSVWDADRLERAGHELETMKTRKAGSR